MIQVAENIFQIRGRVVHVHLLRCDDGLTLIDGGFLSLTPTKLESAIAEIGHDIHDLKNILLSHGHIDHTLNIAELKERSGATLYAPALDKAHIEGAHPYRGFSRICGVMERIARQVFDYEIPSVDHWFAAEEVLPIDSGIRVIDLPGHTSGHCGFYFENRELLFAADLFANFLGFPELPPVWFNENSGQIAESIRKANRLALRGGVLLSHCHEGHPADHRQDLRRLAERIH